jgi:hypothetical protein
MHEFMIDIQHVLGLKDSNSGFYLFWSGIGANLLAIIGGIVGFIKLKRQRDKHHKQLKDHIDYKFAKLTDEETT